MTEKFIRHRENRDSYFPLGRPKVPHLVFNGYGSEPISTDVSSLFGRELGEINEALNGASVCNSIDELYKRHDNEKGIIIGRTRVFIANHIRATVFKRPEVNYEAKVFAGDGIYNSLVAAGVITLKDALELLKEESKAMHNARSRYKGGTFVALTDDKEQLLKNMQSLKTLGFETYDMGSEKKVVIGATNEQNVNNNLDFLRNNNLKAGISTLDKNEDVLHTPLMGPAMKEFRKRVAKISITEPPEQVAIIGHRGNIIKTADEIREEILFQAVEFNDQEQIDKTMRSFSVFKQYVVGRDEKKDNTKYVVGVGAFMAGVGLLALVYKLHHDKPKQ